MTYFLLTKTAWYLMQDGTELYLDKADLTPVAGSTTSYKITLPKQWFRKGQAPEENKFLPGTLQIKLNAQGIQPFREPQVGVLSVFSVPLNKVDFDKIIKIKNLPDLISVIYSQVKKLPRSFQAPYLDYIFFPKNYESQTLIFPQIIFTEDISTNNFKKGFNDPSLGEILLWVTWLMGLTPRPRIITRNISNSQQQGYQRYLLDFIVRSQHDLATQPTTMATLEKAFKLFSYDFSGQPKMLAEVLKYIKSTKEIDIQVNALPSLSNQSITLTFSDKVTFTEVMDAIANFLEATWDWQNEDSVYLVPIKPRD